MAPAVPAERIDNQARRRAEAAQLLKRAFALLSLDQVTELAEDVAQEREVRICVQCGEDFKLSASEAEWFTEKKLSLPKRCEACRRANREAH